MSKNNPYEVIKQIILDRQDRLIDLEYLDLDTPDIKTGPCCAIGALIQALPDEDFNKCLVAIRKPSEKHENHNGSTIGEASNKELRELLMDHYKIQEDFLTELQTANDGFNDGARLGEILATIRLFEAKEDVNGST